MFVLQYDCLKLQIEGERNRIGGYDNVSDIIIEINQFVDNLIYWKYLPYVFKGIIYLIIISFIFRIFKGICEWIKDTIHFLCNNIEQIKAKKVFRENRVNVDIDKSYEKAPLVEKRNFLWSNRLFKKSIEEEYISYLHIYLLILRSSMIFLFNPQYISNFLKGSVVVKNPIKCTCGEITLTLSSFIIIPNKITYAEVILRNLSNEEIQFRVAKDKVKDFIKLKLYDLDNITYQKVSLISNNNYDVVQNGSLCSGSEMNLALIFKAIKKRDIHDTKKAEISGYLKFQGRRDYFDFLLPLGNLDSSKEVVYQHISNMFTDSDLFTIFKCGGVTFVSMSIIIILFLLSIVIRTVWINIALFILALIICVISVPINIVIIQYIYDLKRHQSK